MSNVNIKKVKSSEIEFKDRLVSIQRVTKVTKGGRTFSFSAIVVVGNENGVVGYGLGKAKEVTTAISKGIDDAKKHLIQVPVHKGTIPHAQEGKYSGALVLIKPAAMVPVSLPVVPCVLFLKVLVLLMYLPSPKVLLTRIVL
jgi:small subunit ribosomal protein S5